MPEIQLSSDLCAVCGRHRPPAGRVYCSEACRIIAYNFRKRLMFERLFLTLDLGFSFKYADGVMLTVHLPDYMKYAYPESSHTFTFAPPSQDSQSVSSVNADDFWKILEDHLGKVIASYAHWLYDKSRIWDEKPVFYTRTMMGTIRAVLDDPDQFFLCEGCKKPFVRSLLSGDGVCTDCFDRVPQPF